jgi:hypothetical protein
MIVIIVSKVTFIELIWYLSLFKKLSTGLILKHINLYPLFSVTVKWFGSYNSTDIKVLGKSRITWDVLSFRKLKTPALQKVTDIKKITCFSEGFSWTLTQPVPKRYQAETKQKDVTISFLMMFQLITLTISFNIISH